MGKKKKKSLVGWTYKNFVVRYDIDKIVHSEILRHKKQLEYDIPVKVRITIEEL